MRPNLLFAMLVAGIVCVIHLSPVHAWGGYRMGLNNNSQYTGYPWDRGMQPSPYGNPYFGDTPSGYGNAYQGGSGYVGHWGGAYYGGYHYAPSYYGPYFGGVRMNPYYGY